MASWLSMVAAEIDNRSYTKYTEEQRKQKLDSFYSRYLDKNLSLDSTLNLSLK